MMEQRTASGFHMFEFRDSKSTLSAQDSSTSSGLGSGGLNANATQKGLVSRLGFKFDVANFDINAVSPTSW